MEAITITSLALTYLDVFSKEEVNGLLEKRIEILEQYIDGINQQMINMGDYQVLHKENVLRMKAIVEAEQRNALRMKEKSK